MSIASRIWRPLLTVAIIAAAVIVYRTTPVGDPHVLDRLAGTPWAAPTLVGLYIVMFALAVPGSALFIAAGFVFTPPVAALLGTVGGTIGSVIAYEIGNTLGSEARERWKSRKGFRTVERSLDFLGLLTLRLLPAFPHSVVNYGSGIAGARLAAFVPATMISMALKSYVYGAVAHRASRAQGTIDLVSWDVWGLLLGLALVTLAAKVIVARRREAAAAPAPGPETGPSPRSEGASPAP